MTEQPSKYNMENVPSQNSPVQIGEILQQTQLSQPPSQSESESGESVNPSVLNESLVTSEWDEARMQEYYQLKQLETQLIDTLTEIYEHSRLIEKVCISKKNEGLYDLGVDQLLSILIDSASTIQFRVNDHLKTSSELTLRNEF